MSIMRLHSGWFVLLAAVVLIALVVIIFRPEPPVQPQSAEVVDDQKITLATEPAAPLPPLPPPAPAGDWPQWRYDSNRSDATPGALPAAMHLQWVRTYPALEPAWEDPVNQDRMTFDRVYEPVVVGSVLLFGSNRNDRVTALDTRTGQELWRFYTDGPVRMPPATGNGKVYVTSDDGHLYCLEIATGNLLWKMRAGPDGRKILGNGRLVSMWPARGGPAVDSGTVYFAGSIWPFMGIFLYAVDAESGKVAWTNDTAGQMFMGQPHAGADAFAGVAPQGALAVVGDSLIVPGGRSVPAGFDRNSGKFRYFHLSGSSFRDYEGGPDSKLEGGSHVSAIGDFYFNHRGLQTTMYDRASGNAYIMWRRTTYPVLTDDTLFLSGETITAYDLKSLKKVEFHRSERDNRSRIVRDTRRYRWEMAERWKFDVDATASLIKAGHTLIAGGRGVVSMIELSGDEPRVSWSAEIEGTAARLIAADERLFVVTLEGRIYAFGAAEVEPTRYATEQQTLSADIEPTALVNAMINSAAVKQGYSLALGLDDGSLIRAIALGSQLQIIAVDPDTEKVARLRRQFDDAGLYGTRISIHVGDAATFSAPPYLAALVVSETSQLTDDECLRSVFHSLRPYGGVVWLPAAQQERQEAVRQQVRSLDLPGAKVAASDKGDYLLLSREGRLSGAGQWTHMYGDAANTSKSDDQLVKLPLGLLWFGGNTHHDILPRHSHGPPEQVVGGRLIIQGDNCLSARDVYTGRRLWKRDFVDIGTAGVYYDETYNPDPLDTTYNQVHIAGANARGTNFVAIDDEIYLVIGDTCKVLDIATGETLRTLTLPPDELTGERQAWGYLGVYGDSVIAGGQFVEFADKNEQNTNVWQDFDTSSSRRIMVFNRTDGKLRWSRTSRHAFRHNAIAVADGRLFAIDNIPHPVRVKLMMRGMEPEDKPLLMCLDLKTGKPVWETDKNVFGTWLGYSKDRHILLQGGRSSKDMLAGEPSERMIAYNGRMGDVIWDRPLYHSGPCMIHGDTVYLNAMSNEGAAASLLTGEPLMRRHPLTGQEMPWQYQRTYGCNSVVASEYLLSFRSGAAGYYDLTADIGTGNFGGFKSGCTSNLIAADGVLNAPDYTRTCTCSYQNQTSVALVHMSDVEVWTYVRLDAETAPADQISSEPAVPQKIRRMGLNFGAPGDRLGPNGTLWLEWPVVGGPSPVVPVVAEPAAEDRRSKRQVFAGRCVARHSSRMADGQLKWVAASALVGVQSLDIELTISPPAAEPAGADELVTAQAIPAEESTYTVRLVFGELENLEPGERVFDVAIQGKTVLTGFDIAAEAGGPFREVIREFHDVAATGVLRITFTPQRGEALISGVELVEQDSKGR